MTNFFDETELRHIAHELAMEFVRAQCRDAFEKDVPYSKATQKVVEIYRHYYLGVLDELQRPDTAGQ